MLPRLRFRAFLSHDTDAAELNMAFFQIFSDVAEVQFEVDRSPGSLNITHLERRLRDCDAMIGIFPYQGDQSPSVEEALDATAYFRLELELAARARKPAAVFYDRRLASVIPNNQGFVQDDFDLSQIISGNTAARSRVEDVFARFCNRLRGQLVAGARSFDADRRRDAVGYLLPRGRRGYSDRATGELVAAIEEGSRTQPIDLGWPPTADLDFYDKLDSLDFAVVDVGPATAVTGVLGIIHSRFVPSIRLLKAEIQPTFEAWTDERGPGRMFGCLEKGYYKDIVYWSDTRSLTDQVKSRMEVALKEPHAGERITTLTQASAYFMKAGKRHRVFVSYAGPNRRIVERFVSELRKHFPMVFDYRDSESLPVGTEWRAEVKKTIRNVDASVLFFSAAYEDSKYCEWEAGLLIDERMGRDLPVFPVILPDAQARNLPAGLELVQAERLLDQDDPMAVSTKLVTAIAELSPAARA